ncbi:hypothetical protein AVEN_271629-1 [Araneus ventricosus]|uniref:Uncharacterized protein n=1 Tax=Araneus ventricosus TaxID=182803 RepID=A0A4Y2SZV8_ARAVE|nr:hypothetical protein AVEN_15988-1 [Araneus ventricosus]GBN93872.1 hypothetical protein AVEN_271629-1 [Araneus ventricosus]
MLVPLFLAHCISKVFNSWKQKSQSLSKRRNCDSIDAPNRRCLGRIIWQIRCSTEQQLRVVLDEGLSQSISTRTTSRKSHKIRLGSVACLCENHSSLQGFHVYVENVMPGLDSFNLPAGPRM